MSRQALAMKRQGANLAPLQIIFAPAKIPAKQRFHAQNIRIASERDAIHEMPWQLQEFHENLDHLTALRSLHAALPR
jgi:hypothetical protein